MCARGHESLTICHDVWVKGYGCPYCTNQKVCKDNCLATRFPEIARQWDHQKNGELTASDVAFGSNKKFWWVCEKKHSWLARVADRTSAGFGCPYCAHVKVGEDNCLAMLRPDLARGWHPEKNGKLTPKDFAASSNKKVWWQCSKGHSWRARVLDRSINGSGCPYCSGRVASAENNLAVLRPDLAKEFHPWKNNLLTPKDLTPGSSRRVWWKCEKGHDWRTSVDARNRGTGCPRCVHPQRIRTLKMTLRRKMRMLSPELKDKV
jgi:hypothetical protein